MSAGAQTIRDVLIRIGLQTSTSGFSSPDFKKVEREANDATAAVNKLNAAMSGRRVGGGGGGGGAGGASSQRAPDMFAGLDIGVNKYKDVIARQRQFNDQILAADEKQLRRSDSLRQHYQALEQQNRRLVESDKQALEISNQRAEATAQLANAGLKLARGIAFVTAANESEYQSMLKLIAQAQGYFDIATGVIDAYKSYITFSKAATAAKTAEAVATATLAAAENTLMVSRVAGLGRGAAGLVGRFGVRGVVGIGGAAAIGSGLIARQVIRESAGLGLRERLDRERADRTASYNSDEAAAARNAAGSSRMQRFDDMIERRLGAGQSIRAALSNRRGGLSMEDSLAGIERDRKVSTEIIGNAWLKGSPDQWSTERLERQKKIQEINLRTEQERQSVLEKEQQALERQLQTAIGIKQAAVETLRAEEQRYQSMESAIGRMSAGEANRLKSIGEKLQRGGQLSRSEAEFLDRSGIGTAQSEAYFRSEGQRRGSAGILSAFNEDRGLNTARRDLSSLQATADIAADEAAEKLSQVQKSLSESFERVAELSLSIVEASEKLAENQANLEQRVDRLETRGTLGNPFK